MPNTSTLAADFTIAVKRAAWDKLRDTASLTTDESLAAAINVSQSTVTRVMAGTVAPSTRFVANTLVRFPFASFDKLFRLIPDGRA